MLGYDFWIQLVVVLIALFYGARKGGMALGLIGGIGLLVLVFGFGVKPGNSDDFGCGLRFCSASGCGRS